MNLVSVAERCGYLDEKLRLGGWYYSEPDKIKQTASTLALALMHSPPLLILENPTLGLSTVYQDM